MVPPWLWLLLFFVAVYVFWNIYQSYTRQWLRRRLQEIELERLK